MASVQCAAHTAAGRARARRSVSTRKLARVRLVNRSPIGARVLLAAMLAERPRPGGMVEVGPHHGGRVATVGVEHAVGRVGYGEHEVALRMQHAVHLAEDAVDVVDAGQREHAEGGVERVGPHERQLGQIALVQLDLDLGLVGGRPGRLDAGQGRVDADDPGALPGEGDQLGARADPEDEDPPAVDVAEQPELGLGGDVGPVPDGVGGLVGQPRVGGRQRRGRLVGRVGRRGQVAGGRVTRADVARTGEAIGHGRSLARPGAPVRDVRRRPSAAVRRSGTGERRSPRCGTAAHPARGSSPITTPRRLMPVGIQFWLRLTGVSGPSGVRRAVFGVHTKARGWVAPPNDVPTT